MATECGALFNTEGDGEAIVAAVHYWGPEAVARLRGMFAFLIWDTQDRVLFGARDPFGIKPLFVAQTPDGVAFSSEAKGLRELTGQASVNVPALQHYLVLQYVPEPATMDPAIRKIESGTHLTVRPGRPMKTKRYFHPVFASRPAISDAERSALYQRIAAVMDDSVAKHMRADVTVGAFLSGGIDSTAIAALAKRYNPDLMTFTTGFEREGFSEVDVAAESAAAIGVRHVIRTVSEQELTETLPLIIWYLDDPVADPALVPLYFVANEARKHVKVVLSGEGADELFGGYNIYREPMSLRGITGLPGGMRKGLAAVGRALPQGFRGQDMLRRGSLDLEDRYYGNARIFREEQLAGLLKHLRPGALVPGRHRPGLRADARDRPDLPHAARRPVHLDARRHPGQGRQDDHGELAGAAGAVPGHRGVRGGQDHPGGPEGDQADHQAGAAPGDGADRPAARAAPAQARFPGADPAFPGRGFLRMGAGRSSPPRTPRSTWTRPPCWLCWTRTGPARPTTPGGSGRSWCSRSGTRSS